MPTVFMDTQDLSLGFRLKSLTRRRGAMAGLGAGAIGLVASVTLWALSPDQGTEGANEHIDGQASAASVPAVAQQDPLADTLVSVRAAALTHRALTESEGVPESLLTVGDSLAAVADSLAQEGRFSQAIIAFSSARSSWSDAGEAFRLREAQEEQARQLAARRRTTPTRRSSQTTRKATPTTRNRSTETARSGLTSQDRSSIRTIVEQLSQAVSSQDVEQIRRVYPSLSRQEQQSWERFFRNARNLKLTLSVQRLDGRRDSAQADLTGTFTYEQRSSGRRREAPARFLTDFVRRSGRWGLVSIRTPDDSGS
jgi:hypothetical protein